MPSIKEGRDFMKQSGDVGYCKLTGHTGPLLRNWENDTVVSVDCGIDGHDYKTCGYADVCEMYQRGPVGYHLVSSSEKGFLEN